MRGRKREKERDNQRNAGRFQVGNQCEGFSSSTVNKQPQHSKSKANISQITRQHIHKSRKKHTVRKGEKAKRQGQSRTEAVF